MNAKEYLNLDEAIAYLKTTRSTLYKWLQAGKVPAHKLGRQWRFDKAELDRYLNDSEAENVAASGIQKLNRFFAQRRSQYPEEYVMQSKLDLVEQGKSESIDDLALQIISDAMESRSFDLHFQPVRGAYKLIHNNGGTSKRKITDLSDEVFRRLDHYYREISIQKANEDTRQFVIGDNGEYQVNYQSIDTPAGRFVTLRPLTSENLNISLDMIAPDENYKETMRRWCQLDKGLAVISGPLGNSGKNTTMHALINQVKSEEGIIFTFEPGIEFFMESVNQIEILPAMTEERIEELVRAVRLSIPSLVCLWEAGDSKNMDLVLKHVYDLSNWTKIFIMINGDSANAVISKLNGISGRNIEENMIGICTQELVRNRTLKSGKAQQRLKYEFYSGPMDSKK